MATVEDIRVTGNRIEWLLEHKNGNPALHVIKSTYGYAKNHPLCNAGHSWDRIKRKWAQATVEKVDLVY